MAIRIFPIGIAGGTGLIHGIARKNDVAQGRANPDGSSMPGRFPLALILEAAALGGGVVADIMRFTPDISESLILTGAALLGDRGGNAIGSTVGAGAMAAVPYYGQAAAQVAQPAYSPGGRRGAFSYVGA